MSINEQLEGHSAAGADPARLRRVKCCAAGAGILALLLILLIGAFEGANAGAQPSLAQGRWTSP